MNSCAKEYSGTGRPQLYLPGVAQGKPLITANLLEQKGLPVLDTH